MRATVAAKRLKVRALFSTLGIADRAKGSDWPYEHLSPIDIEHAVIDHVGIMPEAPSPCLG